MKRKSDCPIRRSRTVLYDFAFDFTYSSSQTTKINIRSLSNGRELKHYEVVFEPPMNKRDATMSSIRLVHMQTKQSDVRLVVLPKNIDQKVYEVYDRHYLSFDTHTVQLDPGTGKVVLMYVSVQNVQMDGSDNAPPIMNPLFPLKHERYHSLPFFPPDSAVIPWDATIDSGQVPQHVPMSFKVKGEITGTKIKELLGFYVPEISSVDAPQYIADKESKKYTQFTGWKAVGLRFGNVSEHKVVLNLLNDNPLLNFAECGYIVHPTNPSEWGAAPDGLLTDTAVLDSDIPPELKNSDMEFDFTKGVCEIKSSRWNCKFSGDYIPQCMWEMMCAQVAWCDLVRYCEKRYLDPTIKQWTLKKECKKIRLFRHLPSEQQMLKLALAALKAQKRSIREFVELVHTEEYVSFRKHFDQVAAVATVQGTDIPVAEELIQEMNDERAESINMQDEDIPSLHPAIDRIEERQPEIFRLYQEVSDETKQEFLAHISSQMQDYAILMESKL